MLPSSAVSSRRHIPVIAVSLVFCLTVGFTALHSSGIVGLTMKNGGTGCICHGLAPTDSVNVWITGPDSLRIGSAATFVVHMRGGPAVAGGFNVAAGTGALIPKDSTSQIIEGELTHTAPKPFVNDSVQWAFQYVAPVTGKLDTIFSVANSTNADHTPNGDAYNFGANFVIHLLDTTTGVEEKVIPEGFSLTQNYPNPFNPATKMSFVVGHWSFVRLTVYDISGREVAMLINKELAPGEYSAEWDGSGYSSGMYFIRLRAVDLRDGGSGGPNPGKGEMTEIVRKMLLVR